MCRESDELFREVNECIKIVVYVDNNKCGNNSFYNGSKIISVEQYFTNYFNLPIIISASRYYKTIANQLKGYGAVPMENFSLYGIIIMFLISILMQKILLIISNYILQIKK